MIRVFVVEEQDLTRQGIVMALSQQKHLAVVGESTKWEPACATVGAKKPDVIVLAATCGSSEPEAIARQLFDQSAGSKLVVLLAPGQDDMTVDWIQAGAMAVLSKSCVAEELVAAIKAASGGNTWLSPLAREQLSGNLNKRSRRNVQLLKELTARELDILTELARGRSNRQISETLSISEGTVRNHVTRILTVLGLNHRTEAAIWARRRLPLDDSVG